MDTQDLQEAAADAQLELSRVDFEAALRRGDASAAAAVYADDATLLAPAADVLHGRPTIERFWRSGVESGIEAVELSPLELHRQGDVAVEIGHYVFRLTPEDGARVVDRGRYLIVHRCGLDGQWRRAAEMLSPDLPRTLARA